MGRIQGNVYNLLTVLFAGAIVTAGSIAVFGTALPKDMPLSEDGFYEIYTAYDYERFWRKAERMDFIDGRLMADIDLNDLSGYESWEKNPPLNQTCGPENFIGDFDGNGHTICGLYSPKGYGLVRNNRGRIHDLTIRNSLILGYDNIGGICQWNNGAIENCVFEGELRSREANPGENSWMAGICTENEGILVKCGYRGTMIIKTNWLWEGIRAGICARNYGQVESCYNLTRLSPYTTSAGNCYAIADAGIKECFVRQDSCWKNPADTGEQVTELDDETVFYLPFAVERKLNEWDPDASSFPECIRQGAEINAGKRKAEEKEEEAAIAGNPAKNRELWAGNIRIEDNRVLGKEALAEEQMEAFVSEAFRYKGENWKNLRLELIRANTDPKPLPEGVEAAVSRLRILDGKQEVRIFAYALEGSFASACDRLLGDPRNGGIGIPGLWEVCGALAGLQGEESWEHHSWQLLNERDQQPEGSLVLYLTEEGEKGFFYKKDKMLYRAAAEENAAELWEALLESIRAGRITGDGICWQDSEVKEEIYYQVEDYEEVPSTEQITELESLWISSFEEIETLSDLQIFPHLTKLSVRALEPVNFDLTSSMAPELEELSVEGIVLKEKEAEALGELRRLKKLRMRDCGLTDVSFLENMTELTELSLDGNEIEDISPMEGLRKLKTLSLEDNCVEDISPLSGLTLLRELELGGNRIRDISPLTGLREMEELRLEQNLIEDYEPLLNMTGLYFLAVEDNPGQELGKAVFTPLLSGGKYHAMEEEELLKAQSFLDWFYPGKGIEARELAEGDLNGDGIMDAAVTGISGRSQEETSEETSGERENNWQERYIYSFLGQADGSFKPIEPLETVWIYGNGDYEDSYGDSYRGMLIAEGMLAVFLGGYECDSEWNRTETYIYRDGKLAESWRVEINRYGTGSEAGFTLYNREEAVYRDYVIARNGQGHGEIMLISEENSLHRSDGGELRRRLEQGLKELEERAGYALPEIYDGGMEPLLAVQDEYNYQYVIRSYPVKIPPGQALLQAAEEFLEEPAALPVTGYTSKEIKENHDRLTGVEVPEKFYMGWRGESPAMLTYYSCEPSEEGGYVHSFVLRQCNEEHSGWIWGGMIYFYEDTGKLVME